MTTQRRHKPTVNSGRKHYTRLGRNAVQSLIRYTRLRPAAKQTEVGRMFDVSQPTVSRIVTGKHRHAW